MQDPLRQILRQQKDQTIRLLHVGSEFREKLIAGDTDGTSEKSAGVITNHRFNGQGQGARNLGVSLPIIELARDFINRHNGIDRNAGFNRVANPVMIFDVKFRPRLNDLICAQRFFASHIGVPVLMPNTLASGTGGNSASRVRQHRRDNDRLPAQVRIMLLFAGRKKTVHVHKEPAQTGFVLQISPAIVHGLFYRANPTPRGKGLEL